MSRKVIWAGSEWGALGVCLLMVLGCSLMFWKRFCGATAMTGNTQGRVVCLFLTFPISCKSFLLWDSFLLPARAGANPCIDLPRSRGRSWEFWSNFSLNRLAEQKPEVFFSKWMLFTMNWGLTALSWLDYPCTAHSSECLIFLRFLHEIPGQNVLASIF